MHKVLMAIGYRPLEDFITQRLSNEYHFVGATVYREGVARAIDQKNPDIIIIRETLDGKMDILSVVHEIRSGFPNVRVIFLAGKREPGDPLLANLVGYGVYDILYGEKINANEVISLIRTPNEYAHVRNLVPKPLFDEGKNKVLYKAPDPLPGEEREVTKTVYVDPAKTEETHKPVKVVEPPSPGPAIPEEESEKEDEKGVRKLFGGLRRKKNEEAEEDDLLSTEQPESSAEAEVEETPTPAPVIKPEPSPVPVPSKAPLPDIPPEVKEEPKRRLRKEVQEEEPERQGTLGRLWGGRGSVEQERIAVLGNKQKILTFVGAKAGVGATTIAFNTAVDLAKKNNVLYIEFAERHAATGYWFELGYLDKGIDTALLGILEEDFKEVQESITHVRDAADRLGEMSSIHKKFPRGLDCLYFSGKYMTRSKEDDYEVPIHLAKELYLYLLFQGSYDFVVLDVPSDLSYAPTMQAILYSHRVYLTVTQDVSCLGQAVHLMNDLEKNGIDMNQKGQIILNRYEKTELDEKRIRQWLEVPKLVLVPQANRECINSNYVGLPVAINNKHFLKTGLKEILSTI